LAENCFTPVAKLIREIPEEEITIQRSIGWLAREDKIKLNTIDGTETISLKEWPVWQSIDKEGYLL
jgi:hypothetical protein